jgi:hypothetical protein
MKRFHIHIAVDDLEQNIHLSAQLPYWQHGTIQLLKR